MGMNKEKLRVIGTLAAYFTAIIVYRLERLFFWERSDFKPYAYIIYAIVKGIVPFFLSIAFDFWRNSEELFETKKGRLYQIIYTLNVILILINGTTVWVFIVMLIDLFSI